MFYLTKKRIRPSRSYGPDLRGVELVIVVLLTLAPASIS